MRIYIRLKTCTQISKSQRVAPALREGAIWGPAECCQTKPDPEGTEWRWVLAVGGTRHGGVEWVQLKRVEWRKGALFGEAKFLPRRWHAPPFGMEPAEAHPRSGVMAGVRGRTKCEQTPDVGGCSAGMTAPGGKGKLPPQRSPLGGGG